MSDVVVVLVAGEALANAQGAQISDQRRNARRLADGLWPLLAADTQLVVLHGNKPQVGFVLFRSELASHMLHPIPLDVCGADTQGATGYMLSQALQSALARHSHARRVLALVTQTVVDLTDQRETGPTRAIGPYFDRERAEYYRQMRGWTMAEEPGRGYRRAVPALPAREILELEIIRQLAAGGAVVIAGGGGGVPVTRNAAGELEGLEAVVETEQAASLLARQLHAQVLVQVLERDDALVLAGLDPDTATGLTPEALAAVLAEPPAALRPALPYLRAALEFLQAGGQQVLVTTLGKLPAALAGQGGLRLGTATPALALFHAAPGGPAPQGGE